MGVFEIFKGKSHNDFISARRERMIKAMECRSPDRIPLILDCTPHALAAHGKDLVKLINEFHPDNNIDFEIPEKIDKTKSGRIPSASLDRDEWGTVWRYDSYGTATRPAVFPVRKWEEINSYKTPEVPKPASEEFFADIERISNLKKFFMVLSPHKVSIFDKLKQLCPPEMVQQGLIEKKPEFEELLKKITEYWEKLIAYWLTTGVDCVVFEDNWGSGDDIFISNNLFDCIFLHSYERLFKSVKDCEAQVMFYSSGHIPHIFEQLVRSGMNCFEPELSVYREDEFIALCADIYVCLSIKMDNEFIEKNCHGKQFVKTVKKFSKHFHRKDGGAVFHLNVDRGVCLEKLRSALQILNKYR